MSIYVSSFLVLFRRDLGCRGSFLRFRRGGLRVFFDIKCFSGFREIEMGCFFERGRFDWDSGFGSGG